MASFHHQRSLLNYFSSVTLDRAYGQRKDERWLSSHLVDPATRFFPLWEFKCLVSRSDTPYPIALGATDVTDILQSSEPIFLGHDGESACFTIDVREDMAYAKQPSEAGHLLDLRSASALLQHTDAALLGYARAMVYWHRRQRFCGGCGGETVSCEGGQVRKCVNDQCGILHFPRTDPAIIVIVTHRDRCLLGRQPSWPNRRYSVIAGFVEPGESLEDAVVREVLEETSIRVHNVRYHSSQPWPFPGSLMLGFSAETDDPRIDLGDDELEDARWFSRDQLSTAITEGRLHVPTRISIAYRLVEDWFNAGGSAKLADILTALG